MKGDIVDQANSLAEDFTQAAIDAARGNAKIVILNHCRYCGEDTPGRNFCNVECRDDYEEEQKWRR